MIGGLLYLTASRPDISFSVGLCARYQANPKQSHLSAVKRIFKYLAVTVNYGLWYSCDTNTSLVGYSDSDWAGCIDDRKSTSGGCFYIGNNLVSWYSKKQQSISLSTAEAEYIAAGSCCTQLIWLNKMLTDYGYPQHTLTIFCDSTSAINISKNPFFSNGSSVLPHLLYTTLIVTTLESSPVKKATSSRCNGKSSHTPGSNK
ncbi:hypothetical protein CsatB_029469 [Cannabis sativa]